MKKLKKVLSLVLVFSLLMIMFSIPAYAEDGDSRELTYTPENTYVLNYSNGDIEGYENWDAKRFYFSPYRTNIWVTGNEKTGEKENWNWCTASVLNMINTNKIGTVENAEGPYASTPVYCVDAITTGVAGYAYQRVNLEESGYFTDEVAGRVRAIITNSFPHQEDMSVITAAVNKWITDNNLSETYAQVQDLNYYEVISATQSVIWTITNNGHIDDCGAYAGYAGYSGNGDQSETWYAENCIYNLTHNGDYTETGQFTSANINAVAHYLESLAPMAQQDTLISEAAFANTEVDYAEAADGTYTATITATINATVDDESTDKLILTAVSNGKSAASQTIKNGRHVYTMTIPGLTVADITTSGVVKLAIDGVQTASDVFLFDPLNGREASQTMAGFDCSTSPVHAEMTVTKNITFPDGDINEIEGNKVWNDADDKDGIRPETITVDLYANGVKQDDKSQTVSAETNWEFSFTNLPAKNDAGESILYTVMEADVPSGYVASITQNGANFTITNSHAPKDDIPTTPSTPTVDLTSVTVTKTWVGDEDSNRPAEIQVQLLKDGDTYGAAVTLNAANKWSHTWKYLVEGPTYTVAEVATPDGYTSAVSGSATDGFTITNTAVIPEEPTKPENPTTEVYDPDVPKGDKDADEPLYHLDEDGVPKDYMEVGDPDVPKTSDNSNLMLWLTIAALSALALVGLNVAGKRSETN